MNFIEAMFLKNQIKKLYSFLTLGLLIAMSYLFRPSDFLVLAANSSYAQAR